jgi:hypothetical protein
VCASYASLAYDTTNLPRKEFRKQEPLLRETSRLEGGEGGILTRPLGLSQFIFINLWKYPMDIGVFTFSIISSISNFSMN